MIPLLARLQLDRPGRRGLTLWLPLFLVWLILAPLLLTLWPLFAVGCLIARIRPLKATGALVALLAATSGADLAIDRSGASLRLRLL
ncbi:MAG: hypothetical protein JWM33_1929 [Caulobacteraceae bacterium]|nr:hypothetical protein [Caulobacteraceae bacterium]